MAQHPDRYRRTLDSLIEGFQIIGFDWTYQYVNPAAAAHGRRTPADLHGRTMWDAYPGIRETPLFRTLERTMNDRQARRFENLFTFPDGTERWFELRIDPVEEGLCIYSIDIQERKEAEEVLLRSRDELDELVRARTRDLEAANRELDSFCHSVSHDLRAPLRHLTGYAELLREAAADRLDEEATKYLNAIGTAATRMNRLIDDLLQLSRFARKPIEVRPVSLDLMIAEVRDEVMHDAGNRTIGWSIPSLPTINADPALLRVAIANLLSNAVKYTRGRPEAQIEIGTYIDDSTDQAVLFVRDNGVGFDMRYSDKLFGAFQRLHSPAEFEGNGIGLANVHRVITRQGGRVWAEGQVDHGATFYISLPRT